VGDPPLEPSGEKPFEESVLGTVVELKVSASTEQEPTLHRHKHPNDVRKLHPCSESTDCLSQVIDKEAIHVPSP